ncbi:Sarcosine oxidase subunit alpha [Trichinella spiralis]|uniref:Sarcosine oxidase subunit alpha n=1 Tax=Trichinella spiralis TaxID=6334 RepID=A0ABR3K8B3_TRISP
MKLSGNIVLKVSSAFSSSAVRFRQTNPICIRHPTFRPFSHPVSTYQKHLAVDLGRHRRRRIHISIDWQRKLFALFIGIWVSLPWAISFLGAATTVARIEFYGQLSNSGCRFTKNFVHGVWLAVVA